MKDRIREMHVVDYDVYGYHYDGVPYNCYPSDFSFDFDMLI